MSRTYLASSLVLSLLLTLGIGASRATAGTETLDDPAGDAPAAVDLTSLRVAKTKHKVVVAATVSNLGPTGRLRLSIGNGGEIYHAVITKKATSLTTKIGTLDPDGSPGYDFDYTCKGLKAVWNSSTNTIGVTIKLPQCFRAYSFINGARLDGGGRQRDVLGQFSMIYGE